MIGHWTISRSENGWIVSDGIAIERGMMGRSWVADSNEQLGKLIERLANEATRGDSGENGHN